MEHPCRDARQKAEEPFCLPPTPACLGDSSRPVNGDGSPRQRFDGVRRRLVLVIDDNAAICDMLSWALELAGFRASAIPGGESALTWIDTAIQSGDSPTLILLDLSLETKAAAYLHRLRARWKTAPPPIIVLTTSKEIDNELAGERVVHKPFHVHDLLVEVQKVLPPF